MGTALRVNARSSPKYAFTGGIEGTSTIRVLIPANHVNLIPWPRLTALFFFFFLASQLGSMVR